MKNITRHFKGAALLAALLAPGHAMAQEREWALDAADQDVFLTFGVPNTDDVALSLWCTIGSGQPKLFALLNSKVPVKDKLEAEVSIGKDSFKLAMKTSTDNHASIETEGTLPPKLMSDMESEDHIAIDAGAHKVILPLEGADVQGFMKLCRQSS